MGDAPLALKCSGCGSPFEAGDLDLDRGVASCRYCKAAMLLPVRDASAKPRRRPPAPLPERITVRRAEGGTVIERRWFTPMALFLLAFAAVWMGMLAVMAALSFLLLLPFMVIHIGVGVWLAYTSVAQVLNTTRITVSKRELSIAHGPLPWPGSQTVPRGDVGQLYCKRRVTRGKDGERESFELWAVVRGRQVKLVAAGLDMDQALYLEQELERALGIEDREVAGELAR